MKDDSQLMKLAGHAVLLAKGLPASVVESVAHVLSSVDQMDWESCRNRIMAGIAHAHYRSVVLNFLDNWRMDASDVSPEAVSAALLAASWSEQTHRDSESVELVWTGPDVGVVPLRRTEQALLQVIESATERLTVVSYAVYKIPRICEALIGAADRGVLINVIIETPNRLEGQNTYDTLKAIGPSLAARCGVFLWPSENRAKDGTGKSGILHVKCAVADGRWLFLSSANLTEYAFTLNMELGLLIIGGNMPSQVESQFARMIQTGALVRI